MARENAERERKLQEQIEQEKAKQREQANFVEVDFHHSSNEILLITLRSLLIIVLQYPLIPALVLKEIVPG